MKTPEEFFEKAKEIAQKLDHNKLFGAADLIRQQQEQIDKLASVVALREKLIVELNGRIERMIEKQSHYEAMAHAGGFEAGRELGMKQERALWELAASTQEIEK
jgi:hypothetical protein